MNKTLRLTMNGVRGSKLLAAVLLTILGACRGEENLPLASTDVVATQDLLREVVQDLSAEANATYVFIQDSGCLSCYRETLNLLNGEPMKSRLTVFTRGQEFDTWHRLGSLRGFDVERFPDPRYLSVLELGNPIIIKSDDAGRKTVFVNDDPSRYKELLARAFSTPES